MLDSPLAPSPRRTRARRPKADDASSGPARKDGPRGGEAPVPTPEQVAREARRIHLRREIAGITLLVGALFIAGALLFGRTPGPDEGCAVAGGPFGPVGGCLRWSILGLLGGVTAAIIPLVPAAYGLRLLGQVPDRDDRRFFFLTLGLAVIVPVAVGLARAGAMPPGAPDPLSGLWGSFSAFYVVEVVGSGGAWFIVAIAVSALFAVTVGWNPVRAAISGSKQLARGRTPDALTRAEQLEPDAADMPAMDASLANGEGDAGNASERDGVAFDARTAARGIASSPPGSRAARVKASRDRAQGSLPLDEDADAEARLPVITVEDESELPTADLLAPAVERDREAGRAQLDAMGEKLMESLRTFKVDGTLTGRTSGPTVTQYEIEPAPGVKVRQFANLANDLALAMRAASIRVVAPIPGKGAVGVEVPNPEPEMVAFRDMIESRDYQTRPMALPIALGKDLEGSPVIADLAKMPHLLIAGATGSGKSVCVNTIITSLIYRHTPKTLRFLMVDPKMVELSVYNVLPHLRHRVVTDNRDAAYVLKWAVLEMQERYTLLAKNGARNIQDFNAKVRDGVELKRPKDPHAGLEERPYTDGVLPYIVVIIDELADLMMTVAAEVETPLAMLAQKARAIGIHLILATQRPSVNVITGLIKANFPSRIAFRVASQIDSRTIIDGMGAESLLGNGDMLFIPPGKSEPSRLQGAYMSNEDTERLMTWYKERKEARKAAMEAQGLIHIDEHGAEGDILETVRTREALESHSGDDASEEPSDRDKLFREAAEVCVQHQGGSTSLLQRRLKVGYGRAARIIDQLHAAGVLGPPDGSKPREVLVGLEDLDRIAGDRSAA
ncbi:MAG TPA: DNA translocase FtsK [Gemmatimonadaceae bacterium]|nr:DNA translocase FtsK [Gemmatimonadaceae bacterium]